MNDTDVPTFPQNVVNLISTTSVPAAIVDG
jgi:hypothetical protein